MGFYGDEKGDPVYDPNAHQFVWAFVAVILFFYVRGNWSTWRRWWIEPPPFAFFRSVAGRFAWGVAGCLAFLPFVLALTLHSLLCVAVGVAAWAYLIVASAYGKRLESRPRDVWESIARGK